MFKPHYKTIPRLIIKGVLAKCKSIQTPRVGCMNCTRIGIAFKRKMELVVS